MTDLPCFIDDFAWRRRNPYRIERLFSNDMQVCNPLPKALHRPAVRPRQRPCQQVTGTAC
ncbi:hypothetical protein EA795_04745 [Stutzerimonas nitrititolerans]|uniref:Transposase n=1 Tax=Stutzerimonas nitrititolerans TaxID=2482751 RepID=A0ABX9V7Y6_9GAMM|nr:hypothetical protein EA795_04745 [Stutzerimonas nitrititolerans]